MATINYWGLTGVKDSVTVALTVTVDQLITAIAADEGLPTDYYKISVLNNPAINDTTYGDSSSTLTGIGIVDGDLVLCTPNQVGTKEDRQIQKLEIAAKARLYDSNSRAYYDITQLPTQYSGNSLVDNANSGGLVEGRPWIAVSYSVSPASASVNEGSGVVFNVTTAGVADATTLYWTVANTTTANADFSAVSGSFTITSNAGSFTVTTISDLVTEGAETFTVQVRTGSTSGTVVATSASTTVNDTSTSPDSISGLRFWIDTAATSTLNGGTYTDGAALTAWTERKQAAAFTAQAANRRPTIQSGAGDLLNGYPVVRFDATTVGDWDQAEWTSVSGFASATGYTMVCLAKLTANTNSAANYILRIRNASGTYSSSIYYVTGTGRFQIDAPTGSVVVDSTVDPDSTWKIVTVRYDSTATLASRVTFRWNKTARTLASPTVSGALAADAGNNIMVGYFNNADFGEMMVYNTALSDADIILLENYLSSKWGV